MYANMAKTKKTGKWKIWILYQIGQILIPQFSVTGTYCFVSHNCKIINEYAKVQILNIARKASERIRLRYE